jgi:hypothetical protein
VAVRVSFTHIHSALSYTGATWAFQRVGETTWNSLGRKLVMSSGAQQGAGVSINALGTRAVIGGSSAFWVITRRDGSPWSEFQRIVPQKYMKAGKCDCVTMRV